MYCIQPIKGIVQPRSKRPVKITLQVQEGAHGYMPQGDEFIVKSTQVMADDLTDKDVFEDMFSNEANKVVDEVNVMVAYDNNSGNEQVDPSHEDNAPPVSKDINSSSHKDAREQDSKRLNFRPLQIGSSIKASRRCRAS